MDEMVYRIFDPVTEKYIPSGRGLHAKNGRSIWHKRSGALVTIGYLPPAVKARVVIKKFRLVEERKNE